MTIQGMLDLLAAIIVGLFLGSMMGIIILEAGFATVGIIATTIVVFWAGERLLKRLA